MAEVAPRSALPLFHAAVDWNELHLAYPAPDVFADTVYQWPAGRVRDLQSERFADLMARAWENPFYRARWRAAGLRPGDVRDLTQLHRLPTFTAGDIKRDQEATPPFGSIAGIDPAAATLPLKVQTSGGTTGRPRPTLYGPVEWEMNALTCARGLYVQGARPGDVAQIPATPSLANFAWGYYKAAHDYLGILPVTTGSGAVTPSRRQLELAFDLGTTIWISFPEYLTHLPGVARQQLGRDVRQLGTKLIATCLGPDLEGRLRARLEDAWQCAVYDNYGTHEFGLAAFECTHQAGLHVMEDCLHVEVVDRETGAPLPDGETGDLVVTVFFRTVMPIVRYNVRDLGRFVATGACRCGSSFRRLDHFLGRSDDMVKVRGVNVHPMACLSAVQSDARTTGEWTCIVDRTDVDGAIRDELTVAVEVRRGAEAGPDLAARLRERLASDLGLRVRVQLVPEGELEPAAGATAESKRRRVVDRRHP